MFEIVPDVPDQLTVNQCYVGEMKAANSHFEFLFLQLSNLNPDSQASIVARKSLLTAYEDFSQATAAFFAVKKQKTLQKINQTGGGENGN